MPKAKRKKPERHARLFLIVAPDGACLLERRPEEGIWGGLWSPPQHAADAEPDAVCRLLGLDAQAIARVHFQPRFRHTFTHYHLFIEPVQVMLQTAPVMVRDDARLAWVMPERARALGLSAPAVKLLAALERTFELTAD